MCCCSSVSSRARGVCDSYKDILAMCTNNTTWTALLLLLEIVLPGAARFAARERALVVALAGVDASMARQMAAGRERFRADAADVFLLSRSGRGSWL